MNRRNWFSAAAAGIAWLTGSKASVAIRYPAYIAPSKIIGGLDEVSGDDLPMLATYIDGQYRHYRIIQMPLRWIILKPPVELEGASFSTRREAIDACVAALKREGEERKLRFHKLLHKGVLTVNEMREFNSIDPWNGGREHV